MGIRNFGFFKKDKDRTPGEKAQKAQLRVAARLLACGYLIYIAVDLIKQTVRGEAPVKEPLAYLLAAVVLVPAAVIIILTVAEFVRDYKAGRLKKITFYQEEFGESFTEQDVVEYEAKHAEEATILRRRNSAKDSFSDREELERLLHGDKSGEPDALEGEVPEDDADADADAEEPEEAPDGDEEESESFDEEE